MNKKSLSGLSEQEERLVSAYIDGELGEFENRSVASRVATQDPAVLAEIEGLEWTKNELTSWMKAESSSSPKIDIWWRIERELKSGQRRPAEDSWFEQFSAGLRALFRPRYVGGFAALTALFIVAFELRSPTPGEIRVATSSHSEIIEDGRAPGEPLVIAGNRVDEDLLTKVGFGTGADALPSRLAVPEALAARLLANPMRMAERRIPGGLRAGEADIEWIKTQTPFRMVSTNRPDASPVIWVARASK